MKGLSNLIRRWEADGRLYDFVDAACMTVIIFIGVLAFIGLEYLLGWIMGRLS